MKLSFPPNCYSFLYYLPPFSFLFSHLLATSFQSKMTLACDCEHCELHCCSLKYVKGLGLKLLFMHLFVIRCQPYLA